MATAVDALDAAIDELTKARSLTNRIRGAQVRGAETRAVLKSTSYAWFKTHRPIVEAGASSVDLSDVDKHYKTVLDSTERSAAKRTYLASLAAAKAALVEVRSAVLTLPILPAAASTDDLAPDFAPLAGSADMRDVLTRRWHECHKCVDAGAHLAAIVMMGGLLEALFVARANKMGDKGPLIRAASAPKDREGKTLNYQDWMLDSYIKVGHELNWISDSARQVADVLKEFRNYIHPAKELRHGVSFAYNDSTMFWNVTKSLVRQLLLSASKS
jgi:hypothetical protein